MVARTRSGDLPASHTTATVACSPGSSRPSAGLNVSSARALSILNPSSSPPEVAPSEVLLPSFPPLADSEPTLEARLILLLALEFPALEPPPPCCSLAASLQQHGAAPSLVKTRVCSTRPPTA